MAPRGPHPTFLLPLILLAVGLAQLSEGASYEKFVRQHVDNPKTIARDDQIYCNLMMQRRGLTRTACKPTNTFIDTPINQLRDICKYAGTPVGDKLYDSHWSFDVTVCRVLPGSYPGNCKYRAAIGNTRIRVGCEDWLPVHLEPTYLP
ncbi:axin-1 [Platysternon megacephalum]|uniref:Axin-1 n=1 Tax=Platysternon megacephalum TaxID=55544 RepID=A0A4D9DXF7_9SAUR|nr:axin-1 [Platysternon megacephalum]